MSRLMNRPRFLHQVYFPRRHAHIVAAAIITLLTLLSATGHLVWQHWLAPLPHPDECSRDQLLKWIATRDVSHEPATTQIALANQFERLLRDGTLVDAQQHLSPKYVERVQNNRVHLIHVWLDDRADRVKTLPPHQARSVLDQSLETIITLCRVAPSEVHDVFNGKPAMDGRNADVASFLQLAAQRWLETYDVSKLSAQDRAELSVALTDAIFQRSREILKHNSMRTLDELREDRAALRQRRHANLRTLVIAWLTATAAQYAGVAPSDQEAFIASRCEEVSQLQGALSELAGSPHTALPDDTRATSSGTTIDATSSFSLSSTLQKALSDADDSSKQQLQNLLGAMQREWLRQTFRWLTR